MREFVRVCGYVGVGAFLSLADVTFKNWLYWAILASVIVVDVSRMIGD